MKGLMKINKMVGLFEIMFGVIFAGVPWLLIMYSLLSQNKIYLITYFIGMVSIGILIVLKDILPKRTPYGNEMLGKIRGFKNFLETADKSKFEELINNNPEYFYNILPYTYSLGISNKCMEQFEAMVLESPSWYVGYTTFNVHKFNYFVKNVMNSAQLSVSTSSSGGGSSGGSSGGGSGGGGGGSW